MKIRILIVDDYPENIVSLTELIKEDDVEIVSASNADQALDLLSREEFGLALLDVEMPGTGGLELAKLIRGVRRFKSLPIIFVTAHSSDSGIVFRGYETGAVDVLFKPLNPYLVRAKVRTFVELASQKLQLQQQIFEMEKLKLEAEAANLAKSYFLANMSHEIRTPLGAVLGYSDLIVTSQLSGSDLEHAGKAVRRNGELLLRLIDDVLDLSRAESGHLHLELKSFDIRDCLADIQSTCKIKAAEENVQLRFTIPDFVQHIFISDELRIKQVLLNIIGNAMKFSRNGEVDVLVFTPSQLLNEKVMLRISVKDSGIGMTETQISRLFAPFSQADVSTKRKFGGSGLGLVISREIARATGGDVTLLESAPGSGSEFEIVFHLALANQAKFEHPNGSADHDSLTSTMNIVDGKRFLIVDDIQDNRVLIAHYLKDFKVFLHFAENGRVAVDESSKNNFDLILMDIQMPEMDGREASRRIRKSGSLVPIIALTAYALESERLDCLSSGCNYVITKPVTKKSLLDGIVKTLKEFS